MGLLPELPGDLQRLDAELVPEWQLVAGLMQLPVVTAAERHGELVADLHADGTRLGKAQVVRIAGLTAADQTGLRGDEVEMRAVADPFGLGKRQRAFVDPTGG